MLGDLGSRAHECGGRVSVAVGRFAPLLQAGVGMMLWSDPCFEVVGRGLDADSLVSLALTRHLQVALVDESTATKAFLAVLREASEWTATVVLARNDRESTRGRLARLGVAECGSIDMSLLEVARLISGAARPLPSTLDGGSLGRISERWLAALTKREREVIEKTAHMSIGEVAADLDLSPHTVATHKKKALSKLSAMRAAGQIPAPEPLA
jgi:DNA-binding NarL/FixJ family response regulator